MDRSEQHVEGIAGEEVGDVVHPVAGSSRPRGRARPEAPRPSPPRPPRRRRRDRHGRGGPSRRPSRAGALPGSVVPEPTEQVRGLGEPEEMLGHRDLDDPRGGRPLAVGDHLLDGRLDVALVVGPQMEVVVEHARSSFRPPARAGGDRARDPLSRPAG